MALTRRATLAALPALMAAAARAELQPRRGGALTLVL